MESEEILVQPDKSDQDEKIDSLLVEFSQLRDEIKSMIGDLEKIRGKVDTLIPETLDVRYQRFFEEKVKAVTGLFSLLLEMRKEIGKSLKDEIEVRRRVQSKGEAFDISDMLDIRGMARKVDDFKSDKQKVQNARIIKNKTKVYEGIDIPGLIKEEEI